MPFVCMASVFLSSESLVAFARVPFTVIREVPHGPHLVLYASRRGAVLCGEADLDRPADGAVGGSPPGVCHVQGVLTDAILEVLGDTRRRGEDIRFVAHAVEQAVLGATHCAQDPWIDIALPEDDLFLVPTGNPVGSVRAAPHARTPALRLLWVVAVCRAGNLKLADTRGSLEN
jgi:hypothetical protein